MPLLRVTLGTLTIVDQSEKVGHVLEELLAAMANIDGQSSSIVGPEQAQPVDRNIKLMCISNSRLDGVMLSHTVLNLFFQFILVWLVNIFSNLRM